MIKKVLGIVLILIGIIALFVPIIPGIVLIIIGLALFGSGNLDKYFRKKKK